MIHHYAFTRRAARPFPQRVCAIPSGTILTRYARVKNRISVFRLKAYVRFTLIITRYNLHLFSSCLRTIFYRCANHGFARSNRIESATIRFDSSSNSNDSHTSTIFNVTFFTCVDSTSRHFAYKNIESRGLFKKRALAKYITFNCANTDLI